MFYKRRPLIELSQENHIVCDNPNCDYVVKNKTKEFDNKYIQQYINKPCPECGENLLTYDDYKKGIVFIRITRIINFLFSWITVFINPDKEVKAKYSSKSNTLDIIEDDDSSNSNKDEDVEYIEVKAKLAKLKSENFESDLMIEIKKILPDVVDIYMIADSTVFNEEVKKVSWEKLESIKNFYGIPKHLVDQENPLLVSFLDKNLEMTSKEKTIKVKKSIIEELKNSHSNIDVSCKLTIYEK